MLVTLLSDEKLHMLSLPDKVKGQYWLTNENEAGEVYNLLEIEGIDGEWKIKSNHSACLCSMDETKSYKSLSLQEYNIYKIALVNTGGTALVITEANTEDRTIYNKFLLRTDSAKLMIGRSEMSDICYVAESVSSSHAALLYEKEKWSIQDMESTNGTFVNGVRIYNRKELNYGDVIYIMGMKIVVCSGFFAINNPDGRIRISSNQLFVFEKRAVEEIEDDEIEIEAIDYYYRSPRLKRDITEKVIKVDSPPGSFIKEELPIIMVLGPSVTMGVASLATAAYSVYNAIQSGSIVSAIPSMAMALSMLLGTVLWPVLSKKYEKKRNDKKETERIEKYEEYLNDIKIQIDEEILKQSEILEENYPDNSIWREIIMERGRSLWERSIEQDDFLMIRIGRGEKEAGIQCIYQERRFSMENDFLQKKMFAICENLPKLQNVPITVSLVENSIFGIIGEESKINGFLNHLLIQMSASYSYDEIKYVTLMNRKQEEQLGYLRRLPHSWDNERKIRFVATDYTEVKEVSAYLEQEIAGRLNQRLDNSSEAVPYYVVFVLDKGLADKAEMLKMIYSRKEKINVSVVFCCDSLKKLPKECSKFIDLNTDPARIYDKKDITGKRPMVKPDYYWEADMDALADCLAAVQLDLSDASYNLPTMLTFLEMYQVGKIEHLNAEIRWKESNPVHSLEVPIGIDTMGELFKLDLHEKYHGPHGLVAGMTGSGKSEFIMTFILSMAVNYHPNEVAFVLIDYKGGGMAKAFETLPHTAGIITNLDGAAVTRSLVSIQSELKRRQSIFAAAGKQIGESNIDIYKYQKLYRDGRVQEPLQHLFIVSDEFAELKTQQPEFMEQLVSAARIGRSLGIHLILATQKPAGVVDDQIWSNSRFRICLKVQDRTDSMDMLKRPDAAGLATTGRFYLQVGYNEIFELGQSAWAGAGYMPVDKLVKKLEHSVELLGRTGKVLDKRALNRQSQVLHSSKQLDEIVAYLAKIAEEEAIHIRSLWLPPIPSLIFVDQLCKKYSYKEDSFLLNPVIGEYDDPSRQQQNILTLPLSRKGNAICYGTAGNGKTTFLTTVLYSLLSTHTPDEVTIFIMDFSSETLRAFSKAPHVGEVLVSGDDDKIESLFKFIHMEIEKRKQACAEFGGDFASYVQKGNKDISNLVIIIHNYAGFAELYEEYEDEVVYQSREGIKYGIYFILTALSTNAIRYRLQQNFNQMFVLQMNDVSEYATVLGNVGGMLPSKIKGRGLMREDMVYEFQTAYAFENVSGILDEVKKYCTLLLETYGEKESSIPMIPECITPEYFQGGYTLNQIPIGIEKKTMETQYYDFYAQSITVITGKDETEGQAVMLGLLEEFITLDELELVFLDGYAVFQEEQIPCNYVWNDFDEIILDLYETVLYRNNTYKDNNCIVPEGVKFEQRLYVIYGFREMKEQLTEDSWEKLKAVLERLIPEYHVSILLCGELSSIQILTRENWYKKQVLDKGGVYLGDGIKEQFALTVATDASEFSQPVGRGYGYVVKDKTAILTKLITAREEISHG